MRNDGLIACNNLQATRQAKKIFIMSTGEHNPPITNNNTNYMMSIQNTYNTYTFRHKYFTLFSCINLKDNTVYYVRQYFRTTIFFQQKFWRSLLFYSIIIINSHLLKYDLLVTCEYIDTKLLDLRCRQNFLVISFQKVW